MNILVLKGFNNYFNRIVKFYATLDDYKANASSYVELSNINFNPDDGVRTELVLGKGQVDSFFDFDQTTAPDYLVCYRTLSDHDEIESRWFIIESDRTRGGQYRLLLKRDVIVDNYSNVVSAPTFVEKAYINDVSDPLLFNNESMTYNQIKVEETLLKDKTGCGWVVGYIPQDAFATPKQIVKDVIVTNQTADITVSDLSSWNWYAYCNINSAQVGATTNSSSNKTLGMKLRCKYAEDWNVYPYQTDYHVVPDSSVPEYLKCLITFTQNSSQQNFDTGAELPDIYSTTKVATYWPQFDSTRTFKDAIRPNIQGSAQLWNDITTYMQNRYPSGVSIVPQSTIDSMLLLDGQTIKDTGTDTIYKIKVINSGIEGAVGVDTDDPTGAAIMTRINSLLSTAGVRDTEVTMRHPTIWTNQQQAADTLVGYNGSVYSIILEQIITYAGVEIDSARNHVIDAPYDIFCIPYSDTKKIKYGDQASDVVTCNKTMAIGLASEIAKDAGTGSVYDVQLLPYCPCTQLTNKTIAQTEDAEFDIRGISFDLIKDSTDAFTRVYPTNQTTFEQDEALYGQLYDEEYRPIYYYTSNNSKYYYRDVDAATEVLGAVLWCTNSMISFDIDTEIEVSNTSIDRKIENECDMYRLCSGNYAGIFEFSAAKGAGVSGFKVDCTFKPYNPYIHVIPKLSNLYGNFDSFNDSRGLICSGDFSLAQLSNAWANYELNNKNYQNTFDRQIQNLDVNNSIARTEAKWQAGLGSVTGATSGMTAGGLVGGPWGAAIGGVVGGGASLAGGVMDYKNLIKRQEEEKDYAIDQFGYQLGNIKAIPTSLAKNSSLTPNTKIFPFVEKYTCTDAEKQALRDKIVYDGMTVMRVGTASEFIENDNKHFFRGRVIRIPDIAEDTHLLNEIYAEINKGVYL